MLLSFLMTQGYDSARAIELDFAGLRTSKSERKCYPNVTYTHSRSHVLNLAISSSCCQHCFNQKSVGQCYQADLVLTAPVPREKPFYELRHGRSGIRCDRAAGPVSMDQVGGSSDKAMKAMLKGSRVQEANHAKTMCDVTQPGWRHCCLYRPNPGQYGITRTNQEKQHERCQNR